MTYEIHEDAIVADNLITVGQIKQMFEMGKLPDDTPVAVFFMVNLDDNPDVYPIQAVGLEQNSNTVGIVISPRRL